MNYKIYQSYYKEEQKKFLNEEFCPFDNTSNKRPDLLEYYIFRIGYKRALSERLSHWGFFSWKWEGKTKIKSQKFIDFIEKNPDQDVYLINWCPYIECCNLNLWRNSEIYHPGITFIADDAIQKMKCDIYPHGSVNEIILTEKNFCCSSYFIASKKFWNDYLVFLNKFKNTIDNNRDLKELVYSKTTHNNKNYSYFPFIVERLFSIFLFLTKHKYKILNYPYDFSIYEKYVGENYKEMKKASELKLKFVEESNKQKQIKYYNEWINQCSLINFPIKIPDFETNENKNLC
jgi:hypothetical protein